jgi:hypothetical protein
MNGDTDSTIIRQIEFELEKAEHGMGMPYDAERVGGQARLTKISHPRPALSHGGASCGGGSVRRGIAFPDFDLAPDYVQMVCREEPKLGSLNPAFAIFIGCAAVLHQKIFEVLGTSRVNHDTLAV